MCGDELVKELQPPVNRKTRLYYGVWDFCRLQSRWFAPGKGQIKSDRLS